MDQNHESVNQNQQELAPCPPDHPQSGPGGVGVEGGIGSVCNENDNSDNNSMEDDDNDYIPPPSQSRSRTRAQRKKIKHLPHHHKLLSPEDRAKFEEIRDKVVSDPAARQRLRELGIQGGAVDKRVWAAFKHAYRVPANYSEFAKSRDHVDPQSLTYSNTNNTGPFAKRLRGKPDPNQDLVDIDEPEGCIFEADEGVPILLLITKLQSKELQDNIVQSGSVFSSTFPFNKGRQERDDFQHPPGSMFSSGQAHYCLWWATGQLLNKATISKDVIAGKPPAPLSKRALKARKPEAKRTRRKGNPGASSTKPPPSNNAGNSDADSDSSSDSDSDSEHPVAPARLNRTTVGDRGDPQRTEAWSKLFDVINEALQIASMLIERVNPDLATQYHELSETLKADTKKHGEFLSLNDCHLPGIAVHFNMQPEDGDFHLDGKSMFMGWDQVLVYGDFEGTFEVKDLGVRIRFRAGDILLLRGAALAHKAGRWTGKGRMVIVPFCDGRLFAAERTRRPTSSPPLYGSSWGKSRGAYPYTHLYYVPANE